MNTRDTPVALTLPLVLVGMPGSGKSKVGRALARRLGVPHVDTDDLVVEEAGRAITEIFADEGEQAFREREARAVRRALTMGAVVSLGGGAVTTPEVRAALHGRSVVLLDVSHEELLRRTSRKAHRPLLADDPDAALRRLGAERAPLYAEVATARVASDSGPVSRVVEEILRMVAGADGIVTVGAARPYDVVIGHHLGAAPVLDALREDTTRALVVHPASVADHAAGLARALRERGVDTVLLEHPDAEAGKTLEVAAAGWKAAGDAHLGRHDVVLGVGGGATTDLAGFVAATWLRGVDVIQVPTTLLGMVDAAVGGKTGINTDVGKNLVGSFHTPVRVVEDLDLLGTLPAQDLRAGLGEVVKCGFIADPVILDLVAADPEACLDPGSHVLRELVIRSVSVKARVVGEDLEEAGLREVLNYGHTLAHAIERCEDYHWRHGDAVAVGCVFAAELAHALGLLDADAVRTHREILASVGLPTAYDGAPLGDLVEVMLSDKKVRSGRLRFVLLDGLQHPVVRVVDPADLEGPAREVGIRVR